MSVWKVVVVVETKTNLESEVLICGEFARNPDSSFKNVQPHKSLVINEKQLKLKT